MSLKGKAAAIGIGELKPLKEPGNATALQLMGKVAAEAAAGARARPRTTIKATWCRSRDRGTTSTR